MDRTNHNLISNIPEISAIYFALLQCGYDYYSIERGREHNDTVRSFVGSGAVPSFFCGIKQNTCEVYPYWPRAAILETASFYLSPDHLRFREYDAFRERIMSAGNIADGERNQALWTWIAEFPAALSQVLESDAYQRYLEWENRWIAEQNVKYEKELSLIQRCLDMCVSKYGSPVRELQIVVNPIKCVYSADYHLAGDRFVFSSGDFRLDSVIHEFLHHVVHPVAVAHEDMVLERGRVYPDLDESYYLSGDTAGQLNAFEEYAARRLTKDILAMDFPKSLTDYLRKLLE